MDVSEVEKIPCPYRYSNAGPTSPSPFAIPTTLLGQKLHSLHSSPNIVTGVKCRWIASGKWRVWQAKTVHSNLVKKNIQKRGNLVHLCIDGMKILTRRSKRNLANSSAAYISEYAYLLLLLPSVGFVFWKRLLTTDLCAYNSSGITSNLHILLGV